MYRSFISWRYLFARRTNLIGMVGILVAVAALIMILSIMTGFLAESRRVVRGDLADVLIQPIARNEPLQAQPLLDALMSDERVEACTPTLMYGAIIAQRGRRSAPGFANSSGVNDLYVQLIGVDVDVVERLLAPTLDACLGLVGARFPRHRTTDAFTATDLFGALAGTSAGPCLEPVKIPLLPFLAPGPRPERGPPRASIVVGEQLFASLGMRVGEVLELATVAQDPLTGEHSFNNRKFVIAGTFRSGDNKIDGGRIYMARSELSTFLGNSVSFTHVLTRLHDYETDARSFVRDQRRSLEKQELIYGGPAAYREVRTWEDMNSTMMSAIENERVLMGIMLSLVLVVAGFTIFAILSMMVTEKRRDIGILGALGATPRGILDLFLLIAFWDALLGTIMGAVIGIWAALRIDPIERALSDMFGVQIFDRNVYMFDHIPAIVEPTSVIVIVLGAFACSLLFAAVPSWRAARLDPLEALRYE